MAAERPSQPELFGSAVAGPSRKLRTAHQAVQPYSVGGYVNYLEANQPASRYFGANPSRLTAVRQTYDPGRIVFSGLNFDAGLNSPITLFDHGLCHGDHASAGAVPSPG
jgi:hypothetical protein